MKECECTEYWSSSDCEKGEALKIKWVEIDALLDTSGYKHLSEELKKQIRTERDNAAEKFRTH